MNDSPVASLGTVETTTNFVSRRLRVAGQSMSANRKLTMGVDESARS